MKFLIDAQLPTRLAEFLNRAGHDAVHTIGLPDGNRTTESDLATRRRCGPQAESSNASLIETEVMADLVAHRLDDLRSETFAIVTEMADKRVAEDQDLVRDPTAPK